MPLNLVISFFLPFIHSVRGSHLEPTFDGLPRTFGVIQGSLAEGEIIVTLGGYMLDNASTTYTLSTGVNQPISIVGTLYDGYKGILVRLESVTGELDLTAALLPGLNTVVASACEAPVVGISHSEASFKKETGGTIRLDEAGEVYLDITMVGINDNIGSVYGHTRFLLSFVAPADAPVDSPTGPTASDNMGAATVQEPELASDVPSGAPSTMPSDAPSSQPSGVPSDAPSSQPSDVPRFAPAVLI